MYLNITRALGIAYCRDCTCPNIRYTVESMIRLIMGWFACMLMPTMITRWITPVDRLDRQWGTYHVDWWPDELVIHPRYNDSSKHVWLAEVNVAVSAATKVVHVRRLLWSWSTPCSRHAALRGEVARLLHKLLVDKIVKVPLLDFTQQTSLQIVWTRSCFVGSEIRSWCSSHELC
jgi:hypothetical protein